MKKTMILFNGPAGSGKTTIAHALWKKIPRTAIISLDEIKWLLSDYKSNKFDLNLASKVGQAMSETYLKNKINIIIEKAFCDYEYIEPFIKLAKKHKYRLLIYNLEAPLNILKNRAAQRSITNTRHNKPPMTVAKVTRLCNYYHKGKFKTTRTFDTSKLSQRKIINQIIKDLKLS